MLFDVDTAHPSGVGVMQLIKLSRRQAHLVSFIAASSLAASGVLAVGCWDGV